MHQLVSVVVCSGDSLVSLLLLLLLWPIRERREAERRLDDLKRNRSVAMGRQKGFEEEILHYR